MSGFSMPPLNTRQWTHKPISTYMSHLTLAAEFWALTKRNPRRPGYRRPLFSLLLSWISWPTHVPCEWHCMYLQYSRVGTYQSTSHFPDQFRLMGTLTMNWGRRYQLTNSSRQREIENGNENTRTQKETWLMMLWKNVDGEWRWMVVKSAWTTKSRIPAHRRALHHLDRILSWWCSLHPNFSQSPIVARWTKIQAVFFCKRRGHTSIAWPRRTCEEQRVEYLAAATKSLCTRLAGLMTTNYRVQLDLCAADGLSRPLSSHSSPISTRQGCGQNL